MSVRLIHAHGAHALVFHSPWGILSLATIPQPPGEPRSGWLVSPATLARATLDCKATGTTPGSRPQKLRVHGNSRAPNARSRGKVTCSGSSSACVSSVQPLNFPALK